jgi:hypothetical protein
MVVRPASNRFYFPGNNKYHVEESFRNRRERLKARLESIEKTVVVASFFTIRSLLTVMLENTPAQT